MRAFLVLILHTSDAIGVLFVKIALTRIRVFIE